MDEKELEDLTKQYETTTKRDPKATLPPGADAADIVTYLQLAKNGKQLLAKANAQGDGAASAAVRLYLADLKRVARGRAIQRELARFEGRDNPFLFPFPELDPNILAPWKRS